MIENIYYLAGALTGAAEGLGRSLRSPAKGKTQQQPTTTVAMKETSSSSKRAPLSDSDEAVTPPPTPSLFPCSSEASVAGKAATAPAVDVAALYDEAFRGSPRRNAAAGSRSRTSSSEDGSQSPPLSSSRASVDAVRRKLDF